MTWSWQADIVRRRIERLERQLEDAPTAKRRYELKTIINRWWKRLSDIKAMEREDVE